ncbi:MAG: hypothetical protein A3C79_01445 [Candidatus Taylorbacteria bacterium RIFCSPHIGHO2_02_FULL_45_28]|uniref:Leucine-binding protein domain-containing protein n=1 Tax=Candidatus Taylorbacteria bacterium RIFCSPHIGHO2_12_FULL_45_16 TaxID=1802315 RepID=A0A1G2MYH5_9BACT|nr:MAG: hypothetical protein A2830_03610 [Candidatus Taylorbacteria bacterium RIFCSPHIGHO2_01_FULL_44_110]OHA25105.1 MAG: hypothetical protein A3C79_01445 [Candidatus Taylorbacteria bacterium RIFCSPHIGHO2_02_FULL_45_28]OHA28986.1 MAG: hypothetical protein A3F51_01830 [Candidatus Taylorbacteria bacterium RIFCSPHIGHO2_12_FULL_45_16]OHA33104.1 MAG: hypothetical protein A3A23_03510 [Candidatus Taylorbacteria bacterium RIFCSPLOWO2_01_FULL_45_59]OHA39407.1 MAG: hypothetical protein A3I98_02425 [Candi
MKKTIGVIMAIIVVILIIWAVSSKSPSTTPTSTEPIKVASLLSLTGGASAWGENAKKGIELATEEINNAGGINGRQIQMIYEDTASDPKRTVSVFQHATGIEKVTAIIGPLNQTETASVIPLIEQTQIPSIAPGFLPVQNRTNLSNPVLIWTDAESESGQLAEYVYNQGIRKVGVIGTLDAWEQTVTNAFVDKFKALGGNVTDVEVVQPSASDMKLPVTKVLATKPEAIYFGTYYQFVNSSKEVHNLGFKGKLYGIEVDDYLAGETSQWTEGLQFIAPDYYATDFIKKFTDKFGVAPGMPAGQSYDSANILFSFLKKSTDQKEILEAMKDFKEYQGTSGKLTISSDGRSHLPLAVFQLNGGKVSKIESLK